MEDLQLDRGCPLGTKSNLPEIEFYLRLICDQGMANAKPGVFLTYFPFQKSEPNFLSFERIFRKHATMYIFFHCIWGNDQTNDVTKVYKGT